MPDKPNTLTVGRLCAAAKSVDRFDAEVLLAHVLRRDRAWLRAHDDTAVTAKHRRFFEALIKRRIKHEPVAYILGQKEFYGRPFAVNRQVLIPRPETELLVERALMSSPRHACRQAGKWGSTSLDSRLRGNDRTLWDKVTFWDVGTGSGAIGITLALENPRSRVIASDISRGALTLARKNARLLSIKNMTFVQADSLSPALKKALLKTAQPLVIVANLPYLPDSDRKELAPDVVKFEPHGALFGGKDGLDIIRRLLKQIAAAHLDFDAILLECDPRNTKKLKHEAARLFPGAKTTIHRDLAGRMRVVEVAVK